MGDKEQVTKTGNIKQVLGYR